MLRISFEYICYRILAPHRKGYGIHSPFVFSLFTNVFRKDDDENLDGIKRWRNELSRQNLYIETEDIGAGSQISFRKRRSVKNIIRWSSITHKYGRILYFTAKYFEPATIIELGTGLGISTAYLSSAVPSAKMISIDADRAMHEYASAKIKDHTHNMPEFCLGRFEEFLLSKLNNAEHPLLIFIDGDHQYKSVTRYLDEILKYARADTIILIHDIHWSAGMKKAWNQIKDNGRGILCIDLFFMGMVFFRGGMLKQNYIINF